MFLSLGLQYITISEFQNISLQLTDRSVIPDIFRDLHSGQLQTMYLSHALTLLCLTATIHGRSDTYAANCDAPPPKGGYKAPDFPTMKKVLQVAFNDACSLASFAYPIAQNLESAKDSTQ